MVRGLDLFRDWFAAYTDQYLLIGGTAASLTMEDAGLPYRATKDLDIVLSDGSDQLTQVLTGFRIGFSCWRG